MTGTGLAPPRQNKNVDWEGSPALRQRYMSDIGWQQERNADEGREEEGVGRFYVQMCVEDLVSGERDSRFARFASDSMDESQFPSSSDILR